MIIYKQIKSDYIDKVICDKCGIKIDFDISCACKDEAVFINYIGGFTSRIGDGTKINIQLCSRHFQEMIIDFLGTEKYSEILERENN